LVRLLCLCRSTSINFPGITYKFKKIKMEVATNVEKNLRRVILKGKLIRFTLFSPTDSLSRAVPLK
jgi:hypothetical protein